ncbi:hypothetical protein LENED_010905 [Lentinula edodes]|uniref:Uncharacterized protein n=1 Tax=Lentinula edodes TaxID=5353 RepID=A0A1Q3ENM4_LENED|nr:hypothetical protein LENED_010905 [Lentinula edodes]
MRITLSVHELPDLVKKGATYQKPVSRTMSKAAKKRAKTDVSALGQCRRQNGWTKAQLQFVHDLFSFPPNFVQTVEPAQTQCQLRLTQNSSDHFLYTLGS